MLTDDLFQKILIDPALDGDADCLRVVSGFASSKLARYHVNQMLQRNTGINIELIVGMTPSGGISRDHHEEFRELSTKSQNKSVRFSCSYVCAPPPVHSKAYCWLSGDKPTAGFIGSANYSFNGFLGEQRELMSESDPVSLNNYFVDLKLESTSCLASNCYDVVNVYEPQRQLTSEIRTARSNRPSGEKRHLSLILRKNGETPPRSGINWGQRPGRDQNQAYISVPVDIQRSDFFPEVGERFSVTTDDGWQVDMVRAQANGKAIHTPNDNASLGRYIRARIGVSLGDYVTARHLENYGRTDVEFIRIGDREYFMDFSVDPK